MERKILVTADGSSTIELPTGDTYHSRHGAIQESKHIFINAGIDYYINSHPGVKHIRIFETGFGTGLNALLTAQYAEVNGLTIDYEAVELYPLGMDEAAAVNYGELLGDTNLLMRMHEVGWGQQYGLSRRFNILKHHQSLLDFQTSSKFNLIYHDAFAPRAQPELWTEEVFSKFYDMLLPEGVLVTYCSKVIVQKAIKAAGFSLEKLAGPPGKREIIRAKKTALNNCYFAIKNGLKTLY